jgi:hypothetical protein
MKIQKGQRVFLEANNSPYGGKFLTGMVTELYVKDTDKMAEVFLDQSITIHVKQDKLTAIESTK